MRMHSAVTCRLCFTNRGMRGGLDIGIATELGAGLGDVLPNGSQLVACVAQVAACRVQIRRRGEAPRIQFLLPLVLPLIEMYVALSQSKLRQSLLVFGSQRFDVLYCGHELRFGLL